MLADFERYNKTPKDLKVLNDALSDGKKREALLRKTLDLTGPYLNSLPLPASTVVHCHILSFKSAKGEFKVAADYRHYIEWTQRLITQGDVDQIKLAKGYFSKCCKRYAQCLVQDNQAASGIRFLYLAISLVNDGDLTLLTPLHYTVPLLCVRSKFYNKALELLANTAFKIESLDASGMEAEDFLAYYFYSGMVYLGLKQFEKALEMFQMSLMLPSIGGRVSDIQVESYKKYLLCCLLTEGKKLELPSYTPDGSLRTLQLLCDGYERLCKVFVKGVVGEVQKVATDCYDSFYKDNNMGLVKQCIESLSRSNIRKLTNTYISMSLAQLASLAKLESAAVAEGHLTAMIAEGTLFAVIDHREAKITFTENPEEYDTMRMVRQLDAKVQEVVKVSQFLKKSDDDLRRSADYIKKSESSLVTVPIGDFSMRDFQ
jgi:COP9 signalosome complex subunit 3